MTLQIDGQIVQWQRAAHVVETAEQRGGRGPKIGRDMEVAEGVIQCEESKRSIKADIIEPDKIE